MRVCESDRETIITLLPPADLLHQHHHMCTCDVLCPVVEAPVAIRVLLQSPLLLLFFFFFGCCCSSVLCFSSTPFFAMKSHLSVFDFASLIVVTHVREHFTV